jgi:hypothetical protein
LSRFKVAPGKALPPGDAHVGDGHDLADRYEVSAERVRRIERDALKRPSGQLAA